MLYDIVSYMVHEIDVTAITFASCHLLDEIDMSTMIIKLNKTNKYKNPGTISNDINGVRD